MSKKRLIITSTISIILVAILLIGSTYSIFTSNEIDENANVYTTGTLDITYTLSEDNVKLSNSISIKDDDSCKLAPYRITVTNNGNVPYMFDIVLVDTTASDVIDYRYINTQVGKLAPKLLSETTDNVIKEDVVVLAGSSVDIDVRVWIADTVLNSEIGKSFYAKLSIDGLAVYDDREEINNDNLVAEICNFVEEFMKPSAQSDADIDFSKSSKESGTNGIYYVDGTENDTNPIYYYRGAVDNNLIFADICWKIVRTTDTGGLKLIYNGTPTDGTCNNTGTASQIGTSAFNSSSNSAAYVGYMYSSPYTNTSKTMTSITDTYYYGNDVTYSNGTYTLTDTITNSDWSTIYNGGLNSNHYTCFSTETTCDSVYYVYYTSSSSAYYITLTKGKKVEDALVDMLGADDSNTSNYNTASSTIKGNSTTAGTIDYWYYNNIEQKGYSDYLEDTVWCNDRTISEKSGWDPDGGSTTGYLKFSSHKRAYITYEPSLECSRTIDSFTVSEANGNGDLDYPVGLLTADEFVLAGGKNAANDTCYLYTGQDYWAGSPSLLIDYLAYEFVVYAAGNLYSSSVSYTYGVRPSVSLKPGFSISGGNGTAANPYIVS